MTTKSKVAFILIGAAVGYVVADRFIAKVDLHKANKLDRVVRRWSR